MTHKAPRRSSPPKAHAASPEFRLEVTVERGDVDGLGHVNNIVYVRWLQEVAMAHAFAVGLSHAELIRMGGVFVVRKHEIEYLLPGFLGERIALRTQVASWKGATSERVTKIVRVSDGALLARATTRWAFVTESGRPTRIPEELKKAFARPVA
jgi:acyl-CoA thioester hydrolase